MPNTNIRIYSYSQYSKSAKNLKTTLTNTISGVSSPQISNVLPEIKENPVYKHLIINWGKQITMPIVHPSSKVFILNSKPNSFAHNKLTFFKEIKKDTTVSPYVPDYYTTEEFSYVRAILNQGTFDPTSTPIFVERNVLNGHSGEGIRLLRMGETITPNCQLITEYKKKKREFRVHFFRNHSSNSFYLYTQEKKRRLNSPNDPVSFQIRNHQHGWVYCTDGVAENVPESVHRAANLFLNSEVNTLDFGALDIIYNAQDGTSWILEVNTAPGITGNTLLWYKERIHLLLVQLAWI